MEERQGVKWVCTWVKCGATSGAGTLYTLSGTPDLFISGLWGRLYDVLSLGGPNPAPQNGITTYQRQDFVHFVHLPAEIPWCFSALFLPAKRPTETAKVVSQANGFAPEAEDLNVLLKASERSGSVFDSLATRFASKSICRGDG